ncbi:hypothetical protein TanjilG_08828 [Lupinus angustifolius]|uniref:Uncharacterized protein n=1 Tax=Lupinus angustifolius TaxID=3871 RepID=A0A394DB06_LUPAN|nr:hypothetical protein TanjilG_08828 [Lupinus angustifolius]
MLGEKGSDIATERFFKKVLCRDKRLPSVDDYDGEGDDNRVVQLKRRVRCESVIVVVPLSAPDWNTSIGFPSLSMSPTFESYASTTSFNLH